MAGLLTWTLPELRILVTVLIGVLLTFIPAAVWCAWQQETEIRGQRQQLAHLDADIAVLWRHAFGDQPDDGPGGAGPDHPTGPLDDEPPTLTADPADTWARKLALLPGRYSHHGQHRN